MCAIYDTISQTCRCHVYYVYTVVVHARVLRAYIFVFFFVCFDSYIKYNYNPLIFVQPFSVPPLILSSCRKGRLRDDTEERGFCLTTSSKRNRWTPVDDNVSRGGNRFSAPSHPCTLSRLFLHHR